MNTIRTEASVTWAQALAWRLDRHLLQPVGSESVAAVVRRLGAVLSMDETLADLAVQVRRSSPSPGGLAEALAAGEVIKAFVFRGSMHYIDPQEGAAYLALRAAGRQWELPSWVEHYRLEPENWPDFRAAVRAALSDGPLTVAELGAVLSERREYRHLKPIFDAGAGTLIKPLSWQGDLSLGPSRDGSLTVRRLDDNPRWQGIPALDEAGPRAVLAYFRTYGPAPIENLRYWIGSGLSAGGRRLGSWVDRLGDRLVAVDVEGTVAYAAREDVAALQASSPSDAVRLLPGHDQWVMGPGTKDTHVTPPDARDLMTRKANPVIVAGVVRGTWYRQGDEIAVRWLGGHRPPPAAVEREASRVASLQGRTTSGSSTALARG
ncbi:winged helix DNA-binding domain-containing protein [Actinoplanes sp. Pm04-4]|uniref:Winged helix DNA-binding domain-containing protein n=1 Tax=Paractinoplanes pyxinae TaxID=2997416 RepID=A0ABT4BB10_9ACTN|nr:crosslink repair DNA glycosylase YcaQ family protein [Actinoplanes pyxinae]MCY1143703.1 winged helix DNA-binding domain-containing protein [Actinoplanes pyxinae]